MPDADMTELGWVMIQTRMLNDWMHTAYSMEQVAEMEPVTFVVQQAVRQGLEPTPGKKEEVPRGRK